MSNFSQPDKPQQGTDQYPGGDQEFTYAEQRRPINRNLVVLLLIAVVGAALIYLMYVRGRFNADSQTPELALANQQVAELMKDAPQSIQQMEKDLEKTRATVESFSKSNSTGQIPVDNLKINPFAIAEQPKGQPTETKAVTAAPLLPDMRGDTRRAAEKAKVQMILYSPSGSTVQINNWVYKEGERITVEGVSFTVKTITRDMVVISNPDGDFTLEIQKGL